MYFFWWISEYVPDTCWQPEMGILSKGVHKSYEIGKTIGKWVTTVRVVLLLSPPKLIPCCFVPNLSLRHSSLCVTITFWFIARLYTRSITTYCVVLPMGCKERHVCCSMLPDSGMHDGDQIVRHKAVKIALLCSLWHSSVGKLPRLTQTYSFLARYLPWNE